MKLGIYHSLDSDSIDLSGRMYDGITYNAVEFGALVALRPASGVLGLAGAELAEVFGCLWARVLEQLEGDASERLS